MSALDPPHLRAYRLIALGVVTLLFGSHLGCARHGKHADADAHPAPRSEPQVTAFQAPPQQQPLLPQQSPALGPTEAPEPSPSVLALPESLPGGVPVGKTVEIPFPGDRDLRVSHAAANRPGALVYLHGMCGNSKGADPWVDLALERGTLVVLRADVPCPDRPGYKWPKEVDAIQTRIDRALEHVKAVRGGVLDTHDVTLIGYSQGAHRAEQLALASPDRYRKVVLGGPPTAPLPESFRSHQSVAVLGGELEDATHMVAGAEALRAARLRARFFLLPRAHHGDYGPEGHRVMSEVFTWLDSDL